MLLSPDHKSIVGAGPGVEKERTKVRIVKGKEKRVFSKLKEKEIIYVFRYSIQRSHNKVR